MMEFTNKSAHELRAIANKALALAEELEKEQPTYALAIVYGIESLSRTYPSGTVFSYSGTVEIEMANGTKWKAIGHKATGSGDLYDDGYIEFIKLS